MLGDIALWGLGFAAGYLVRKMYEDYQQSKEEAARQGEEAE